MPYMKCKKCHCPSLMDWSIDLCEMVAQARLVAPRRLFMKKFLSRCMLAMLLSCGGWRAMAQEAENPAPQDAKAVVKMEEEVKKEKTPVAKLRGKLLYKKSQIKKLEKAAAAADAVLAEKLQELENQRRALLTSAEPRLAGLYAEHDEMEGEIQKMTERK